jgi:hypothetical protein
MCSFYVQPSTQLSSPTPLNYLWRDEQDTFLGMQHTRNESRKHSLQDPPILRHRYLRIFQWRRLARLDHQLEVSYRRHCRDHQSCPSEHYVPPSLQLIKYLPTSMSTLQ